MNDFVYSARRRGYVIVYDRDARRTFIHVRDMARAFLFGLERFGELEGGVYNAGSERLNLTKDEIARLLLERQPFFLTYGPVGADEDRRDYAVSYARLRGAGVRHHGGDGGRDRGAAAGGRSAALRAPARMAVPAQLSRLR